MWEVCQSGEKDGTKMSLIVNTGAAALVANGEIHMYSMSERNWKS